MCVLSLNATISVLTQQRICLSARALEVLLGHAVPWVLAGSRIQVILLPSDCSLAFIYCQRIWRSYFRTAGMH